MPTSATVRRTAAASALALVASLTVFSGTAQAGDPRRLAVTVSTLAAGFNEPTVVTNAGDARLFVAEKRGYIRSVTGGKTQAAAYLDLSRLVGRSGGEQGLLGLAFHPSFAQTRYLFVTYINRDGSIQVTRFRAASASSTVVDIATRVPIITIPHPDASNHNGGMLAFGPDGMLYLSTGDGGSTPQKAQDLGSLLGKILRLDVNRSCGAARYCIPAGNPFASTAGARKEIWHLGLRNPWRFSFDRTAGSMWIGDVGQNAYEEIDTVPVGAGRRNFGWPCREGAHAYGGSCRAGALTAPVFELGRGEGTCSITGGYVYRGRQSPAMAGTYIFADVCAGKLWGGANIGGRWVRSQVGSYSGAIVSFGESSTGELYAVDINAGRLLAIRGRAV